MAGGKETPRQKMIGMMYLVLTALLAMNISKDVLNAFIQITHGLNKTNSILEEKAERTIKGINASPEGVKAVPFQQKVAEVDKWSDELMDYIELMKAHIVASSLKANETGEGFEEFLEDVDGKKKCIQADKKNEDGKLIISKPDENQNNTSLLIGHDPANPKQEEFSASDLKKKLLEYKDRLKAISIVRADSSGDKFTLPEDLVSAIDSTFAFKNGKDKDGMEEPWETNNFFHMPLVAVLANITKIQTDVMNVKNNVCMALAQGINATDMKFSDITVAVVPKQSFIIKGGEFEAEVYLAAYNKTSQSKIYMAGETSKDSEPTVFAVSGAPAGVSDGDGKCHFKVSTGGMSIGEHCYKGQIEYMKNGKPEYIPFLVPPFFVGEPTAIVNATACNVFYRGLDNPVEISVPGANDKVFPSCQGCESFNANGSGKWTVRPGKDKEAIISVSAEINGEKKTMGDKKFRVKSVPRPESLFAGKKSSDNLVSKTVAANADKVIAQVDPGFIFEGITYTVKSFTMIIQSGSNAQVLKSSSNVVTSDMKASISNAKPGSRVMIEEIMTTSPEGTPLRLNSLNLKLE
jgi:gliding motility-associated protein GldM